MFAKDIMASIDQEIKHNFENNKQRLIANLHFSTSWFKNLFLEQLKPFNISSSQLNMLRILRGTGDWMTMGSIKERMVEKSPNVTRGMDKILKKGYVERKRSETDRRVVYVRISQVGLDFLKEMDEKFENFSVEEWLNLSDEEAGLVSTLLDKMRG